MISTLLAAWLIASAARAELPPAVGISSPTEATLPPAAFAPPVSSTPTAVAEPPPAPSPAPAPPPPVAVSTPAAPVAVSTPPAPVAVSTPPAEAPILTAVPAGEELPLVSLPPLSEAFNASNRLQLSGRASLYLGQFFFQSSPGSVNGYADVAISLSKSLSPESGFMADFSTIYTGFKQVNELVGGGTLFQQSLDTGASFKWLRRIEGGETFKPRLGFKYEFFRETNDETWGQGLYDYWRGEAGLGWEKKARLGVSTSWISNVAYDLYYTAYPNFQSLASQFGSEVGAPNPGTKVLDNFSHNISYRGDFIFPGAISAYTLAMVSVVEYPNQLVVNSAGKYDNSNRQDLDFDLTFGATQRLPDVAVFLSDGKGLDVVRPWATFSIGGDWVNSSQNHFDPDPNRLKFVPSYYDYSQVRLGPSLSLQALKTGVTFDVAYQFAYRGYNGRLTQDVNGNYNSSLLHQAIHTISLGLSWPVGSGIELQARANWSQALSNMDYQQTYKYDYTSDNYYGGASWRF